MRNIRHILSVMLLIMSIASCTKYLDVTPDDKFLEEDFYKNKQEVISALSGAYQSLYSNYSVLLSSVINGGTDELLYQYNETTAQGAMTKMLYDPNTVQLMTLWTNLYSLINRSNDILDKVEAKDSIPGMTSVERNSIIGEALVLRAMGHFYLANIFNSAPLRIVVTNEYNGIPSSTWHSANTYNELYEQVIKDLNDAIVFLQPFPLQTGRVGRYIVRGLLARAYLVVP